MGKVKLSSKNQIVVPAEVRRKLNLKQGAFLIVYPVDDNSAVLSKQPTSYAESLRGLGKDVWERLGGSEKYLQNERNSWDK